MQCEQGVINAAPLKETYLRFNFTAHNSNKSWNSRSNFISKGISNNHFSEPNRGVRAPCVCAVRTFCKRSRDLRSEKQKDAKTQAAPPREVSHHGSAGLPPRLDWGKRTSAPLGGTSEARFPPAAAVGSVRQEGRGARCGADEEKRGEESRREVRREAKRSRHLP